MPLVIFNFNGALENDPFVDSLKVSVKLPRDAYNKRWSLRAVNAVQAENPPLDFRHFEFDFPELLTSQNILHASKSVGAVAEPRKTFRFYPKNYEVSDYHSISLAFRHYSAVTVVSEYPNWDLGEHRLESDELTCVVSAKVGNVSIGDSLALNSFSIILSYE